MRMTHAIVLISILILVLAATNVSANSPYIFGTFFWADGVNIDAYSGKPGWVVNEVMSDGFKYVNWNHQYKQAVDEGHTWILRFGASQVDGAPGVPLNPDEWPRYAAQCAQYAERLKDYIHIYVVGNEMHIGSKITMENYAACYLMVREAIHAVQPDAIVIPGVVPGSYLRSICLVAGDYVDGFTDFHPGTGLLSDIDSWSDLTWARTKPFFITEQGAAHPMPDNRARQHFSAYNTWNASNDHRIESGCWFVYYGMGNEAFSMKMIPMTSADFEEAALNAYLSSYAFPFVSLNNISVAATDEVTSVVSWSTDVPATSSVEYWKEGERTRHITQWDSYAQTPKTNHSIQLSGLEAGATYHYQIRCYAVNRPWTVSPAKSFVQEGPETGTIIGRVLSGGAPVHKAMVARWYEHSPNNELFVRTGTDGTFEMRGVPTGTHNIRLSATGALQTMRSSVALTSGGTADLGDVTLTAMQNHVTANPGFETGNLSGWTAYGDGQEVWTGPWFAGIMPHSGTYFAGAATNFGTRNGGVYQKVPATAGQKYVARMFSNVFRGDAPFTDVISRVGIDPNGSTNPTAPWIQWSDYQMAYEVWHQEWRELVSPVITCGSGGYVTIFLDYKQLETWGWHINCFDDAGIFLSQTLQTIPEPTPVVEPKDSIAEAKASPDGTDISLTGVVATTRRTADFSDRFWIADQDRASGIMVYTGATGINISEGDRVSLTGTLATLSGERALVDIAIQHRASGSALPALFMVNREVGGADYLYDPGPPASGQRGVLNGKGLNNVGLLVKVSGEVMSTGAGYVMISDGSSSHLKVVTSKLSTQPTEGQHLVATGICRVEPSGQDLIPYIELRRSTDVVTY